MTAGEYKGQRLFDKDKVFVTGTIISNDVFRDIKPLIASPEENVDNKRFTEIVLTLLVVTDVGTLKQVTSPFLKYTIDLLDLEEADDEYFRLANCLISIARNFYPVPFTHVDESLVNEWISEDDPNKIDILSNDYSTLSQMVSVISL